MNGVVTLMSNDNGKCIDTCLLSKGCKDCHHWKGKERKGKEDRDQQEA